MFQNDRKRVFSDRQLLINKLFANSRNNINGTIYPAPDAHFVKICLFSDARGQNI